MSSHVLIVEDDTKIAALLRDYFSHAGFSVDVLDDGDKVEAFVQMKRPDLVVLDLQLPGKDGLEICRVLRARGHDQAIMMVTARVDEIDRLLGLELGADDYVCKPFSAREVVARAKAILRRMRQIGSRGQRMSIGPLEIDAETHVVRWAGQPISLTPIEFGILRIMVLYPNQVWSRGQLLERVCATDFSGYERNVDGHIKNLRRKLKDASSGRNLIRTVFGVGYALAVDMLLEAADVQKKQVE